MRDLVVLSVFLAGAAIALIRPYYGMLTYTWISFMYPHELTFGFARTFPGAKLLALSTFAGLLITRSGDIAALLRRETVLLVLLFCTFTVSSVFALNPSMVWARWMDVSKLIIMALITSMLLSDEKRVRYFLLTIALSLGFYGFKSGIFGILTGGGMVFGPGNSIIAGNNNIGLALNMALPFLWYLARQEVGVLRVGLYSAFFLTIPAIMFTYSRASALTLPIVLLAIMSRERNRVLLFCSAVIVCMLALPFVPQRFWDRQYTILQYESDTSAMSRIDNWDFCWRLALDRPLTGGGFEFNTKETFARYAPEFLYAYGDKTWDTHNIYLSILAAHGIIAFSFFLMIITSAFHSCRRLRRYSRDRTDLIWLKNYSYIVEVSFLALLVNGMFVNMEYFDLLYDLVAIVASLRLIAHRALSDTANETVNFEGRLIPVAG